MSKEALGNLPTVPLEALAYLTEEQWEQNWQNLDFVKGFPKLATRLVSPEEKTKLPDDDQKSMVERSLTTFMRLSWKPDKQGFVAGNALLLDENLDYMPLRKGKETGGLESTGESLIRCNIGSFILLGKTLEDKEHINHLLLESYQNLKENRKNNFRQNILRLASKDSLFRDLVKAHSLDTQNGFEWNREMAKLFLQLLASDSVNTFPVAFSEDLKIYPIEVVDEFLNYALGYVKDHPQINKVKRKTAIKPMEFIIQLDNLHGSGYFDGSPLSLRVQQKIEGLKSSVMKKQGNLAN